MTEKHLRETEDLLELSSVQGGDMKEYDLEICLEQLVLTN